MISKKYHKAMLLISLLAAFPIDAVSNSVDMCGYGSVYKESIVNEWMRFLYYFPETKLPYTEEERGTMLYKGNVTNSGRQIPCDEFWKYLFTKDTSNEERSATYYYGAKYTYPNQTGVATIVFRCPKDSIDTLSRRKADAILTTYTRDGQIVSQRTVSRGRGDTRSSIFLGLRILTDLQNEKGRCVVMDTTFVTSKGDSLCAEVIEHHRQICEDNGISQAHHSHIKSLFLGAKQYKNTFLRARSKSQQYPIDTARLCQTYRKLIRNPMGKGEQKAFFKAYPSTWRNLADTYRYCDDEDFDLSMFTHKVPHWVAFRYIVGRRLDFMADESDTPQVRYIPDKVFLDKLISIISSCPQAESTHDMFANIRGTISQYVSNGYIKTFLTQLEKRNENTIKAFWIAYIYNKESSLQDSLVSEMQELEDEYCKIFPKTYSLLNETLKR